VNPIAMLPAPLRAVIEIVLTLAVAAGIAYLAQAYVVKPYRVPTGSMEPTLMPGDRVIADRVSLDFGNPSRGQIVVFHPPICQGNHDTEGACSTTDRSLRTGPSPETFIKRVIGLPGETVWAKGGSIWIKPPTGRARRLDEPYLHGRRTKPFARTLLPAGCYFMMGDNRNRSDDSRMWGCEPRSWMIGIARVRYWPAGRAGLL
jgi:signal peptidase I